MKNRQVSFLLGELWSAQACLQFAKQLHPAARQSAPAATAADRPSRGEIVRAIQRKDF